MLDTNALDLYLLGEPNTVRRIHENIDFIRVSSVTAEERLTGRMSSINRARTPRTSLSLVKAHEDFVQSLEDSAYSRFWPTRKKQKRYIRCFRPLYFALGRRTAGSPRMLSHTI